MTQERSEQAGSSRRGRGQYSRTLRFNLTREGPQVREAKTAGEALPLRYVRSSKPAIVLLDVMSPEISGFELCGIIRKDNAVPIIMLTADDQDATKSSVRELAHMLILDSDQNAIRRPNAISI
jgi:DNA-binding response OmpR family regulator